jgi:hypothetical protein
MKSILRTFASSVAAAVFLIAGIAAAAPHHGGSPLNGDQELARAVSMPGQQSYTVPVEFAVHMHEPINMRSTVEGSAYFQAPANSALIITHATGLLGAFFRGSYQLDLVPQAWPYTYHVTSAAQTVVNGSAVLQLQALPRAVAPDIARVIFSLDLSERGPVAAEWDYTNGSSIRLSYVNGRVGNYILPQRASVTVDMPNNKLDADATYGAYELNAPIPDGVFATGK